MIYIKPEKAFELMKKAYSSFLPVYIYGMYGFGKTALVQEFFRDKNVITYSSETKDSLSDELDKKNYRKRPIPVIFDNLHLIKSREEQNFIIKTSQRENVMPVFISRASLHTWLVPYYSSKKTVFISEQELALTKDQTAFFFEEMGCTVPEQHLETLDRIIHGNPAGLIFSANTLLQNDNIYEIKPRITEVFSEVCINEMYYWSKELQDFICRMSITPSFTKELAMYLNPDCQFTALLNEAKNNGSFLIKEGNTYILRPVPRVAYQHKAALVFGNTGVKEIAVKAGEWYEKENELSLAMEMYSMAEDKDSFIRILKENALQNPSNGQYEKLQKYYFMLKPDEIEGDCILESGMSMVCSMSFKMEESEYWYEKIKARLKLAKGKEKSLLRGLLAYLDIGLPHRGNKSTLEIIRKAALLVMSKEISMPEFSVTSNLPSLMNGGKDFCLWSLNDKNIARHYGKIVSLVLGKNGKGLVNLALSESFFEKAEDNMEILSLLSRAQLETELNRNMELNFVATGILIRFYMASAQMETAQLQFDAFEKKVQDSGMKKFLPNLYAVRCRMKMYTGNRDEVDLWLNKYAPDENENMSALRRYQYLTKIRVYIYKNMLQQAFALTEKIKFYAEHYFRTYIRIECNMLSAMIFYRQHDCDESEENCEWKNYLISALKTASNFKFIRLLSDEGAALLPLLLKIKKDIPRYDDIDDAWFSKLLTQCERMAALYPSYGSTKGTSHVDFSSTARSILRLQSQGLSSTQIAKELSMNNETVRYHIKQNYRKLGVGTKEQAVIAARELRLL